MSMTNEEISNLTQLFDRLSQELGNNNSARADVTAAHRQAATRINESKDATYKISKSMQRELGWLLVSMKEQNGRIEKYGDAFEALGDAVSSVIVKFGPIGLTVGLTVKLLAAVTESAAEQFDQLLDSYDALADSGLVLGMGTTTLLTLANDAKYSSSSLIDLVNSTKILGTNSVSLGATSAEGAENFFKFIQTTNEVIGEFNKLGISQGEISSLQAQYINQQAQLGIKTRGSDAAARKESYGFIDNLLLLASLTGKSKQELLEQQAANKRDMAFQITLNALRTKGDILTAERLDNAAVLSNEFGESYAAGVRDFMSTLTATTEDGRKLLLVTNGKISDWTAELQRGNLDEVQYNKLIANSIKTFISTLGGFETMGNAAKEVLDSLGLTSDAITGMSKVINMSGKSTVQNSIQSARLKEDSLKETQNTQLEAERALKLSKDKLLQQVAGPVNSTISGFANTIKSVVAGTLDFAQFFGFSPGEDILDYLSTPQELDERKKKLEQNALDLNDSIRVTTHKLDELTKVRTDTFSREDVEYHEYAIAALEKDLIRYKEQLASIELSRLKKEKSIKDQREDYGTLPPKEMEQSSTVNPAKAQQILDFIGKYESGGNYNIINGGKTAPLDTMTVEEVLEFQKTLPNGNITSAVGKYQIIRSTLQMLVKFGTVSPTDKFNKETQDRLGMRLLEHRGYSKFAKGGNVEEFANNLAAEWAALPMPNGQSRYGGVGNNAAHVSRKDFISALKAKRGGVFSGAHSGYKLELHGTEAVVPMNNRRQISMSILDNNIGFTDIEKSMSMLDNFAFSNSSVIIPDIKIIKNSIISDAIMPEIDGSQIISTPRQHSMLLETTTSLVKLKSLTEKALKIPPKKKNKPIISTPIPSPMVSDNDQTAEVKLVHDIVGKLKLMISEVEESTNTQYKIKQYKMA